VLGAREPAPRKAARTSAVVPVAEEQASDIQARLRARETPQARFCWHCRKPLPARTGKCPFCSEAQ
jgi:hypothetical protein